MSGTLMEGAVVVREAVLQLEGSLLDVIWEYRRRIVSARKCMNVIGECRRKIIPKTVYSLETE